VDTYRRRTPRWVVVGNRCQQALPKGGGQTRLYRFYRHTLCPAHDRLEAETNEVAAVSSHQSMHSFTDTRVSVSMLALYLVATSNSPSWEPQSCCHRSEL
jgi:hypothetical protein